MTAAALTHLSLFSGIGGIDLAAEWAGFETIGQVEYDNYARRVLSKHWPDVPRFGDIRELTGEQIRSVCGQPTLISGGFPCQPHSTAGKRQGSCDERNLWPELCRILREVRPQWFLGENVAGLRSSESGRFFGGVLRDLAQMGYCVGWGSWEAAHVGAPHHRERVFIVGYTQYDGRDDLPIGQLQRIGSGQEREVVQSKGTGDDVPHPNISRVERSPLTRSPGSERADSEEHSVRLCPGGDNWLTEPAVGRVADGVPSRVDRLRCLGNAVVPQQVYPILRGIAEIIGEDVNP